jgi:membrane-associated phospholipid phosphatase
MKKLLFAFILLVTFSKSMSQNNTVTSAGDILQFVLPATALSATLICKEDQQKPTWQFIKTYGTSIIVTQTLKHTILKPRPGDGPINNNHAFPSGHTTSAFAGAAFIQRKWGWSYGIPCYIIASFVGYSRVQGNFHDTWDVLGGASVGIVSAYIFTKPYQKSKVILMFDKSGSNYMVGLIYNY